MPTYVQGNSAADLVAKARAEKLGLPYLGRPTLDLTPPRSSEENELTVGSEASDTGAQLSPVESIDEFPSSAQSASDDESKNHENELAGPDAPAATEPIINTTRENRPGRSTGPRTPAGKARSSQNARKYGLFAQTNPLAAPGLCLPGEHALHAETLAALLESFTPHTPHERQLVERLALLTVHLHRATRFETSLFANTQDETLASADASAPLRSRRPRLPADPPAPDTPEFVSYIFANTYSRSHRVHTQLSHHQARLSRDYARTLSHLHHAQRLWVRHEVQDLREQTQSHTIPKQSHAGDHLERD